MTNYIVIPVKAVIRYSQSMRLCQDGFRIKSRNDIVQLTRHEILLKNRQLSFLLLCSRRNDSLNDPSKHALHDTRLTNFNMRVQTLKSACQS